MPAFKSLAQLERCRGLVADGTIKQEDFDRDFALTDLAAIPEKVGFPRVDSMSEEVLDLIVANPEHKIHKYAVAEKAIRELGRA